MSQASQVAMYQLDKPGAIMAAKKWQCEQFTPRLPVSVNYIGWAGLYIVDCTGGASLNNTMRSICIHE
jgi:hypothetical protein